MQNTNFNILISAIKQLPQFQDSILQSEGNYQIKLYKITELKFTSIIVLYQNLQKKFYINRKCPAEINWLENELRIFIWLLLAYLLIKQKTIFDMNQNDWNFFSGIFNYKSPIFFEYQALAILKTNAKSAKWSQEETGILSKIINEKQAKNKWNLTARELFIRSNKRFFRNPKQCREKWMNHLDPSKIHTDWELSEDISLLECIKKHGHKWSFAVKGLNYTRTEHMVKNRYNSLISNEMKKHLTKKQHEIQKILIKRFTKLLKAQQGNCPLLKYQNNTIQMTQTPLQIEINNRNGNTIQEEKNVNRLILDEVKSEFCEQSEYEYFKSPFFGNGDSENICGSEIDHQKLNSMYNFKDILNEDYYFQL